MLRAALAERQPASANAEFVIGSRVFISNELDRHIALDIRLVSYMNLMDVGREMKPV